MVDFNPPRDQIAEKLDLSLSMELVRDILNQDRQKDSGWRPFKHYTFARAKVDTARWCYACQGAHRSFDFGEFPVMPCPQVPENEVRFVNNSSGGREKNV